MTHVAVTDEGFSLWIVPHGLLGGLGATVVACHHDVGAADHLSNLARGHLPSLLVNQPEIVAGGRTTDGVQLIGELVGDQNGEAAAFRHAVILDQLTRPALEHLPLQSGGKGCRRAGLVAKGREIAGVERRFVQNAAVLHRH